MTVIALTREVGSLGTEVARGLADALGLTIVESEIIGNRVAERLGVEESAVQHYVAQTASVFQRWQISRTELVRYTTEEILELCQHGNVLIRGWGAAAMFKDFPRVISVRVCAPIEFRRRVLTERLGASDPDAILREIERYDAAHVNTLRSSFGCDRDDALLYHLVLNMARVPIEAAVKSVCELAKDPSFQDGTSLRSTLANKLIEIRVRAALGTHIPVSSAITVSADNGKVTLTGWTTTGNARSNAEKIASKVSGVTEIANRLVGPPSPSLRPLRPK